MAPGSRNFLETKKAGLIITVVHEAADRGKCGAEGKPYTAFIFMQIRTKRAAAMSQFWGTGECTRIILDTD
jgi:hypothetical protein